MFSKKNDIKPFDDFKQFEFLSQKNDNSLFCFASHTKKRPHNLVFARMFDYQLLDMIELGVNNYTPSSNFKVFHEFVLTLIRLQNLILDTDH